jgi:serine/threonine protein kinase
MADPAQEPADDAASPEDDAAFDEGGVIGQYRLVERLGEGGFGVVYLAEQHVPMQRLVALKLLKLGLDTSQVVARFEVERQALALLDHPGIARFYDAGTTPTGRPYFVMEYVRGTRIERHADRRRLSIEERLHLFLQVCEAIEYAHQKGIIHRDLKPSNVLVSELDGRPAPKIIDFGIAKAVHQRLTDKTLYTERGQLIGTPGYMSPEQAALTGLDLDTRTDVYSLGVLLYELLAGSPPFDPSAFASGGAAEVQRVIREVDPPRPSTRIRDAAAVDEIARQRQSDPRALARVLRGELDWIVMKALEKDRTRRYGSVADLAADITRHLNDQPVSAGPPSRWYLVKKFVRRNRTLVAAAALIALALLLSVAGTGIALIRERQAVRQATAAAHKAREVSGFLHAMLSRLDPYASTGRDVLVHEVLDDAAARIGSFASQPDVEAALALTLGTSYRVLGDLPKARAQLRRALELREALQPRGVESADVMLELALLERDSGELDAAQRTATEALEIMRGGYGPEGERVALALDTLGEILFAARKLPEAEARFREALAIAGSPANAERNLEASILLDLALVQEALGRPLDAQATAESARARARGPRGQSLVAKINELLARLPQRPHRDSRQRRRRSAISRSKPSSVGRYHCFSRRSSGR